MHISAAKIPVIRPYTFRNLVRKPCVTAASKSGRDALVTQPMKAEGVDGLLQRDVQDTLKFTRLDEGDDVQFYSVARFAQHVDSSFVSKLHDLYRATIPLNSHVLDLCSSFDSHLPDDIPLSQVTGHGLNEAELMANQRLSSYWLQDLNTNPKLPLGNGSVDAVLCCAAIMYLTQPIAVLKEVARILLPGGACVISFSSHCFQSKAVSEWLRRSASARLNLVQQYLVAAGLTDVMCVSPSTQAVEDRAHNGTAEAATISDPFFAVTAKRSPVNKLGSTAAVPDAYPSLAGQALKVNMSLKSDEDVSVEILQQWKAAYQQLSREAATLGIPNSALPVLDDPLSVKGIRDAQKKLSGIIASYMSAGL